MENGKLLMIVAKVVDDIKIACVKLYVTEFLNEFTERFLLWH